MSMGYGNVSDVTQYQFTIPLSLLTAIFSIYTIFNSNHQKNKDMRFIILIY